MIKLLIFLITIPIFLSILRPGYYPMQDDFQVIRTFEMDKCFRDGQFPCRWVPDMGFGYGYPEFNYYAPLPYYVMELTHLIGFSIIDSVKIFIMLITLASAVGMYVLARYLWESKIGAILSTVLYMYLPFRAVDMYVRGALPELAAMALIPFLFLFAAKMAGGEKRSVFWFSLSAAALFLTHNIATLIVTPVVVLWILLLLVRSRKRNNIPNIAVGFVIAIGLAAFFVFPAWFEKGYIHIDTLTSGFFNYLAHFESLRQIFLANDNFSFSVGIVHWLTAAVAVAMALVYKKHKQLAVIVFFFAAGLLAVFLMHSRSSFIWAGLPVLSFVQFPWRFLMLAGFCFSLVAGAIGLIDKRILKGAIFGVGAAGAIVLYAGYFQPKQWLNVSDADKLSGSEWTKAITASLYDYLPVSAQRAPDFEAAPKPVITSGKVEIVSGDKGTNWQVWKINVSSDVAAVELQIYYFPGWNVKVDGVEVKPGYGGLHGLMSVTLPKGEHTIEARLTDTSLRRVANIVSVLSLAPLAYVFVKRT